MTLFTNCLRNGIKRPFQGILTVLGRELNISGEYITFFTGKVTERMLVGKYRIQYTWQPGMGVWGLCVCRGWGGGGGDAEKKTILIFHHLFPKANSNLFSLSFIHIAFYGPDTLFKLK